MSKKQTIRLNESQLRRIVSESVKRVLKESQYDDLSQDEWDYMYREANDIPQYDLLGLYGYTIWKMKPNGFSLDKQVEESDFKERTNSKQKAILAAEQKIKKLYNDGKYLLIITDNGFVVEEWFYVNGKRIPQHVPSRYDTSKEDLKNFKDYDKQEYGKNIPTLPRTKSKTFGY